MKLSEQIKHCVDGNGCDKCENYTPMSIFTCHPLMKKAYEQAKKYEDMFPCEVGDKIYFPVKQLNRIAEFEIARIQIFKDEIIFFDGSKNMHHAEDFGKTVFLSRAEAESALKDTKGQNEV